MAELEATVAQLEAGDVPLEDSIALYQRGAELRAHCEARLKAAEEKISAITLDGDGNPAGTASLADTSDAPQRAGRGGKGDEIPF